MPIGDFVLSGNNTRAPDEPPGYEKYKQNMDKKRTKFWVCKRKHKNYDMDSLFCHVCNEPRL